jgi:IS605 OrfB family transposase
VRRATRRIGSFPLLKLCNLTGHWAKNPNMLHNHALAKSIADAAWGLLIPYSTYKAADAGGSVIQVNPAYTSQDCSGCGARQASTLSDRVDACLVGGLRVIALIRPQYISKLVD